MNKQETRGFRMHPKLLFDVIQRQAGTLGKAILEGVMNSVDAKATECRVTLTKDRLAIEDNGQGFRSRNEIEKWFEVFGQPHDESEGKVYGNFRMGRGQLFAFGRNKWHSNVFHMDVDIREKGLDYVLKENGQVHQGCKLEVTLYDELSRSRLADIEREVRNLCKYTPIDLYFNDEQINIDPETEKWDYVTDDAYIRIRQTGSLSVYHLGVYIREYNGWQFGVGGVIVAKKQLMLNFARNDILVAKCKIWRGIAKHFKDKADDEIRKKPMNENARQRFAHQMLADELDWDDLRTRKFITAATGRHYSITELQNGSGRWNSTVTVAPKGDLWGDRAMKQGLAFVLAQETLDRFGISTLEELWQRIGIALQETCPNHGRWQARWDWSNICDLSDLFENMDGSWTPLETKELKPKERIWQKILEYGSWYLRVRGDSELDHRAGFQPVRKVGIGIAENGMLAWTDGATWVYFNRDYIARYDFNLKGIMEMGHTLLHELCHDGPDTGTHVHSQEFYEKYHDHAAEVAEFTARVFANLEKWLIREDARISKKILKERDRYEGLIKAKERLKLTEDALYDGIDEKTPEEAKRELKKGLPGGDLPELPKADDIVLPEERGFFLV